MEAPCCQDIQTSVLIFIKKQKLCKDLYVKYFYKVSAYGF